MKTKIVAGYIPLSSMLDPHLVNTAYFVDSYRTPLRNANANITDVFFDIFGHHPRWMKTVLIIRNRIALICGLDAPHASEILHPEIKSDYRVGDTIGVWPIYALTESELVAGRDNKHLDFRLSLLKTMDGDATDVVVSTICTVHNLFGKIYLFFIIPFHKWGMQRLLANAISAGRL